MPPLSPGPRTLVMPVGNPYVWFDADAPRFGGDGKAPPSYHVSMHLYEPLAVPTIVKDADGQYRADFTRMQGRLAERWDTNANATVWTVHLRQGVKSHAGNELTADDVKWSWDRAYALRGVGLWRSRVVGGLPTSEGVEAVDRYTVRFTLPVSKPDWAKFWSFATNAIIDSVEARKHTSEQDPYAMAFLADTPCGFGAFSVAYQDRDELTLSARPDFWAGKPGIDNVQMVRTDSRAQALDLYEKGVFNFVAGLYPAEYQRLVRRDDTAGIIAKTNAAQIDINWLAAPMDNQTLRQAVLTAIPYQKIIDEVYLGYARPASGPILDISDHCDGSNWPYATNPDRARALVQEAGAEGATIQFAIGSDPESQRIGPIIRDALADVGLSVELIDQDQAPPGEMPAMWLQPESSHGIADAHYNIAHEYDPPRGMHGGRYIREKWIVERLKEINEIPEPSGKRGGYQKLAADLVELAPKVFVANLTYLIAHRRDLDPWATSNAYTAYLNLLWANSKTILPRA